jgi:hypothetical protein
MNTPAWLALSVGARALFLELKSNYNTKAQNAVFLSARDGEKQLGVNKDTVCKWMHELEHYRFIVEVQGAHLGDWHRRCSPLSSDGLPLRWTGTHLRFSELGRCSVRS